MKRTSGASMHNGKKRRIKVFAFVFLGFAVAFSYLALDFRSSFLDARHVPEELKFMYYPDGPRLYKDVTVVDSSYAEIHLTKDFSADLGWEACRDLRSCVRAVVHTTLMTHTQLVKKPFFDRGDGDWQNFGVLLYPAGRQDLVRDFAVTLEGRPGETGEVSEQGSDLWRGLDASLNERFWRPDPSKGRIRRMQVNYALSLERPRDEKMKLVYGDKAEFLYGISGTAEGKELLHVKADPGIHFDVVPSELVKSSEIGDSEATFELRKPDRENRIYRTVHIRVWTDDEQPSAQSEALTNKMSLETKPSGSGCKYSARVQGALGGVDRWSAPGTAVSFPGAGGLATLVVMAPRECPWALTDYPSWVRVENKADLNNPHNEVDNIIRTIIPANTSRSSRSGQFIIAGQSISVAQEGADEDCSYNVEARSARLNSSRDVIPPYSQPGTSFSFPNNGGGIVLHVSAPNNCPWSVSEYPDWVAEYSIPRSSMAGTATINLDVMHNPSNSSRSGTLVVAGQTIHITEDGAETAPHPSSDLVTFPPTSQEPLSSQPNHGKAESHPEASPQGQKQGCSYHVVAQSAPWDSTGQGVVVPYSPPSTDVLLPGKGGNIALHVKTPSHCRWRITEHPAWINVAGYDSESPRNAGNTTINLEVPKNTSSSSRSGTFVLGGRSISITQTGQ